MKFTDRESYRFLLAGGINTAITYVIYLGLLNALGYRVSFSIAFVVGIVIAYNLNARFVFKAKVSASKFAQYPLLHLAQYGLGLLLLSLLIEQAGIDSRVAPLVNVAVMVPLTFFLNRWFLLGRISN